jgi:hypothetical protein
VAAFAFQAAPARACCLAARRISGEANKDRRTLDVYIQAGRGAKHVARVL